MLEITQKEIDSIKFSLFSPEMIRRMSAIKITVPDTHNDDGYPIDGGLVDPHMGVIDPGLKCRNCGGRMGSCNGHFGHIELVRPVIHPIFAKIILLLLRSTCPSCHRVLVKDTKIEELIDEIDEELEVTQEEVTKKSKNITTKMKKLNECPHCKAQLPKVTLLKPTTFYKDTQVLLSSEIRTWLEEIPNDDLRILGFDPIHARPEWMILTALPVPPVSARPSITLETGERSEDDLTHKLVDIMRINHRLEANIDAGAPQLIIEDLWELLQYHVSTFFNNEMANIPPARHRSGRPLKTLSQRLKGKEGRFRYNLSGKRVNFSARTVVSPDPNISINEVGVPEVIAEELTIPVTVTNWNLDLCKSYISSNKYPKAKYIIRPDGKKLKVKEAIVEELLNEIVPGWVVERQLVDGDIVLFNRQPSLHRISIMGHEVKVLPGHTFRLNPLVCAPYNADFDGDEMNLHAIQTIEARVEVKELMLVEGQILSPRHGQSLIHPDQDNIAGAFYTTEDNAIYTKEEACDLLIAAGITKLPEPDKKDKYSGKLLISTLFPKDLNLKQKTKFLPEPEGDVLIKDGILVTGALESKTYQNMIIKDIFHTHGPKITREFLDRSSRLVLNGLTWHGLSVSLNNYTLPKENQDKLDIILDTMRREIDAVLLKYKNKTLPRIPGMSSKDALEDAIMSITSNAKKKVESLVEKSLGMKNSAVVMAKSGSRGSILDTLQMSAVVGQQSVRSQRVNRGYRERVLTHFKKGDLGAAAHGYVFSSFTKGLEPTEFFFMDMGGRESLVNTAIRTGRSGYMQRRLMNALQDIVVDRNSTVKDGEGIVVQFVYGGDGLDPSRAGEGSYIDLGPAKDDYETA
ncbi:DNA-directed RNA polymerase subunit A' [Candidatus Micrarchaeota archaeon]|nr:DNA-directed RNA polymerase subunit A' [Candidatus Micrarchaeota archaeon]